MIMAALAAGLPSHLEPRPNSNIMRNYQPRRLFFIKKKMTKMKEEIKFTKFGKKLKDKGITYYECRAASGVPTQLVSNWATGRSKPVISPKFLRLMRWLQEVKGVKVMFNDFDF